VTPLLEVSGLVKRFGGLVATDNLELDVLPGELHGLIGPNGAGKTTVIGQLSGELPQDAGTIRFAGEDISTLPVPLRVHRGLTRSFQIISILPAFTALENLIAAAETHAGHCFRFWRDARSDPALVEPATAMLERFGLAGRAHIRAEDLAHGEQRQLELALALATEPRMLLLDEPMAGLGPSESAAMTRTLAGLKGQITILLVEHDMEAVFALADRISVLVHGRIIAAGLPDEIRADPEVRTAYLGEGEESFECL
jgi:branched-chain amino acid transport system ATP-binding protein